jgi:hypothetical protein
MNKIIIGKKNHEGQVWFRCSCGKEFEVTMSYLVFSDLAKCDNCGRKYKIEFGAIEMK